MRLRRETGDFQIKYISTTDIDEETGEETGESFSYSTIRPGLSMEDLMGEMVAFYNNGEQTAIEVIIAVASVPNYPDILSLRTSGNNILSYNRATGAIDNPESEGEVVKPNEPGTYPGGTVSVGGGSSN